ncbi:DNA alkylation repair protein [Labilibaculum sp.]|uniref:DNA alkylation repair protein n=1 Tax=Labilibaculum sp. TaxID=2060723 RepID=UPI002AA6D3E2|nr:DNA alkylation repair protein [Labilibaculum sp.]MBN2596663.1 DNA alkylation repair protein [Marinifilaceae bacterium]
MDFFIDRKETEELFQEIFKKIQILRNGETHHEMKKFGLNYSKSLGATIVNLREIGRDYQKDHLLAHKLWTKGFRESKIVATLLEEPAKVTEEQLERWFAEMDSNELLEQASMNLFQYLPNAKALVKEWLKSENIAKQVCAVMVVGRLAMDKKEESDRLFIDFIEMLPKKFEDAYFLNQVKRALGKIARRGDVVVNKLVDLVCELKREDEDWREIWDDLQYELNL